MHNDVKLYFEDKELLAKYSYSSKTEKARGGIEKREYWVTTDIGWLSQLGNWAGLQSIGMTRNTITKRSKITVEDRFFISSLSDGSAETFAGAVRGHWVVESFHWHLDVIFKEDNCQIIDKRAALNLNIIRKFAMAILKNVDTGKRDSMKTKRFKVVLNPMKMLGMLLQM